LVTGRDGDSAADARCLWRAGDRVEAGYAGHDRQEAGAVTAVSCGVVLSGSSSMMEGIRDGRWSGGDALAGKERRVRLRDVELGDVDAYVRMRCDPVMMAELGGPLPREGIEDKVARDVRAAAAGSDWIKMIVPDEAGPDVVAGNVVLWSHDEDGEPVSEIGWMVLPEFQGRGLGKQAVRMLLELARDDGRWGLVHAFPATSNAPSNGICRSLGFRFAGERDITFAERVLRSSHWVINPAADLA
jgi:RimJ/RimL family protein N-acetyltransferase